MKPLPRSARAADLSRRQLIGAAAVLCASMSGRQAEGAEPVIRYDFTRTLDGWETVSGTWAIEDMPGASQGGKALVQRATDKEFNVIVAPGGPYGNVAVDVRFKPLSGREDASGGIVFRFSEGRYYVIRANALEDNFNFYYYDPNSFLASVIGGRHLITGVNVTAPALGQWHKLRDPKGNYGIASDIDGVFLAVVQGEANARLIAAAPALLSEVEQGREIIAELVEALRYAEDALHYCLPCLPETDPQLTLIDQKLDIVSTALSRARQRGK